MQKDFDAWNEKKKLTDLRTDAPFCHTRELRWCELALNVGTEQDGSGIEYRRPVLILKDLSVTTAFVIPLTTSTNRHPLRPPVGLIDGKEACALLSQMRVSDTKRLVRKIGYLDKNLFKAIRNTVKAIL